MTSITIPSSAEFLMQLVNPAARAILLASAAGVALAAFRVKSTSARLITWKAVLHGALAMPLLAWMLPAIAIPMPSVLPFGTQPHTSQSHHAASYDFQPLPSVENRAGSASSDRSANILRDRGQRPIPQTIPKHKPTSSPINWPAVATALYLTVSLLFFVRMAIGLLYGRRLRRAAKQIRDEQLTEHLSRRARSFRLTSIPVCAESEVIAVPVTMGVLRPTILLPVTWREWDDAKLDAVVTHEMSHVARQDALTQHLSLLHRATFWFSPLAWWLDQRLVELAEQASDEATLSWGADSNDYAKAVLGFFETLHAAPGRVWWQGVAMAQAGPAERRLERILAWKDTKGVATMGPKKSAVMTMIALAVPAVFFAASVQPAPNRGAKQTQESQAPPAPAKPSASEVNPPLPVAPTDPKLPPSQGVAVVPLGVVIPKNGLTSVAPSAPIPPAAPMAPVAPVGPVAARVPRASQAGEPGYSYAYGYDDDERFVIVSGKTDSMTMSGTTQDARHVERLRKQIPGDFIWFQRYEKFYIIRDQAIIDRARSFWTPQEELGRKQGELGKQQEALGKQQEALGEKMEIVQVQIHDLTPELDKLKAKLKALGSSATQEQLSDIQSQIGDLRSKIGEMQSQAGEQQSKIGEEMSALGEQQSTLDEQQADLGRQQEEAARQATHKMKELLDQAIKNGKAQPEPQSDDGTI